MSAFTAGQQVRIATVPVDIRPWVDTGTIVRRIGVHDPVTGQDRGTETWLVRFDLLLLERAIPEADLAPIDCAGDTWHRIFESVPQCVSADPRRAHQR